MANNKTNVNLQTVMIDRAMTIVIIGSMGFRSHGRWRLCVGGRKVQFVFNAPSTRSQIGICPPMENRRGINVLKTIAEQRLPVDIACQ